MLLDIRVKKSLIKEIKNIIKNRHENYDDKKFKMEIYVIRENRDVIVRVFRRGKEWWDLIECLKFRDGIIEETDPCLEIYNDEILNIH